MDDGYVRYGLETRRQGGLLEAYQRRDPAARSKLEIFLLYPGVHAVHLPP